MPETSPIPLTPMQPAPPNPTVPPPQPPLSLLAETSIEVPKLPATALLTPAASPKTTTLKPNLPPIKPIPERFLKLIKNKPVVKPLPGIKQPSPNPIEEKGANEDVEKKTDTS